MNQLEHIKIVKKPWGRELWFAQTGNYMGKILEIDPGEEVSLHKHEIKEETMYVYQGRCKITTDKSTHIFYQGAFFHVMPGKIHSMGCTGDTRVILFEVSTPFPEDSIRLADKYGRPCEKNKK